jgi:DNA-binding transcriptional LysR family regulator
MQLFERQHRRLVLAAGGERLIGTAQRMVAANDELWGQMTTPAFEGEVSFGVPIDILPTYTPPILRRFHQRWPRVQIRFVVKNSIELIEDLAAGEIDLALTTDQDRGPHAETLRRDSLVWVGARDGKAHLASPIPLAMGAKSCRFRPVVLEALRAAGRDWRLVLEFTNQDAVNATISAGIAVGALLRDSVPDAVEMLGADAGLPPLPDFLINLWLPPTGGTDVAQEFARHVRAEFALRYGPFDATQTEPRTGQDSGTSTAPVVNGVLKARTTRRSAAD